MMSRGAEGDGSPNAGVGTFQKAKTKEMLFSIVLGDAHDDREAKFSKRLRSHQ